MSLLIAALLASGFWATGAGSTLSPDSTYVCNTCHDPLYWDETAEDKTFIYAKPSRIFDMNKKNISQCPDLRTQTTGSRHRCLQACTYAIRAPSNYDPKNENTLKHVALSCGDLYKDFNGHDFNRDPCSLKKYRDGKTELMCRCTKTNCNRQIAQWAHRLTEEWNARNASSALPDDLLVFLFNQQDSLHTEPVVMNSTETPAQGRLKKNQYLFMGIIFGLLTLCFILILCVALYRYHKASANYKIKEKRKKDKKKGTSNGSTYAQLQYIDSEMPNQHPALSKEEADKRWMAMKESPVLASAPVGLCAPWQGKVAPDDSAPSSPREKATISEVIQ